MAMNDSQLTTQANVIKNETATGANTATRVGTMLDDIISNKINNDKIDTDGTLAANSDALVASQKATKTYVNAGLALKEDAANKSNAALGASATLFPTQNAVKTYVDGQVATVNGSITSGLALKENTANKSNGPLGTSSVLFPTENSVTNALVPKENISNKVTTQATFISNGTSVIKYPAIKAVKDYVDGVTVGLLRDNGNYNPTSSNQYPTATNTLSGGPVQVGDTWYIDTDGTMNGNAVLVGYSVRALINAASPTADGDWAISNVGLGFIPENSANKSTDGTFNSGSPSSVLFPTQSAVATYVAANAQDLDQVLTAGNIGTSNLVIGNTLTTPTTSTLLSPGTVQLQSPTLGTAVFAVDGITLDDATATNQMVIMYNNNNQTIDFPDTSGTLALFSDIPAAGWSLTGNAGTTAGTNFIGTTDDEDFVVKTNNVEHLRFISTGAVTTPGRIKTSYDIYSTNNSTSATIAAFSTAGFGFGSIGFDNTNNGYVAVGNGTSFGRITANNLTDNRNFQFPDANGRFVLSVNGVTPNTAGDITIAVSTPSLSAVTAVGNTTTSDIIVNGVTGSKIEVTSVTLGSATLGITSSNKGYLSLSNNIASGVIKATNLTAARVYDLPNDSGTIALEKYKVYTGVINTSTLALDVFENTLGTSLTPTNPSDGVIRFTAAAGNPFTVAKTFIIVKSSIDSFGDAYFVAGEQNGAFPTILVDFTITKYDNTRTFTPNLSGGMHFEIRVYP